MYLLSVDGDNGSLKIMPYSGGLLEQPCRTMQVFKAIQEKMWEKIAKANKEIETAGRIR